VLRAVERRLAQAFDGTALALPLALARIALGALVLLRTTDVARPFVAFNHHTWMSGVEYAPNVDGVSQPALASPLLPGLALGATATWLLVALRTGAAITLLLGISARLSSLLVGAAGAWLMAADRYRYLHHLYLLWWMLLWFALLRSDDRLSLLGWIRNRTGSARVPRWPLQLLRVFCASVYLASGLAKLRSPWLSGETLKDLERVTLIGGEAYRFTVATLGHAAVATAVCALELCLAPILLWSKTRWLGVALGASLHAGVALSMEVSTFGGQMLWLLALFLVPDRRT
jgi:vitamin K-dependent gamma-carboxylase